MAKVCLVCNKRAYSDYCVAHKPKKPILSRSKPVKTLKGKTTKPKAKTRSQLVKELDSVFSKYIRLSNSVNGIASCVTCPDKDSWQKMQDGHFFSRGRYATRWDVFNNHVQCVRCNVFLKGNYINYTRYMIDRYGREFVDDLERKSFTTIKLSTSDLKDMIEHYKKLSTPLLKNSA